MLYCRFYEDEKGQCLTAILPKKWHNTFLLGFYAVIIFQNNISLSGKISIETAFDGVKLVKLHVNEALLPGKYGIKCQYYCGKSTNGLEDFLEN